MAGPIRISILADSGKATANIRATENQVGRLGARFTKLRLPAAAVGAGLVAIGGGLLKLAKGAAEDEKAQATLAQTLRNSAKATDTQVASVEDYISKVGAATGVTDDEMRPALGNLVRATGDVTKAQDLMGLAMNISAGTGKDLGAVSIALAKAQRGNVGGLAKLGIATKDASGKTKSFAQIQADLSKQFAGQSAAAAETVAGKYARVKLQLSEAGEAVGAKLLPVMLKGANLLLTKFVPGLEKTFQFAERNKTTLAVLGGVVAGLVVSILAINAAMAAWAGVMKIITVATKLWAAAQVVLNFVLTANPIGLVIVAIALLVAGVILAYRHSAKFRAVVDGAFKAIRVAVQSVVKFFTELAPRIARAVGDTAKTLLVKGKNLVFGIAKGTYDAAVAYIKWWVLLPGRIAGWLGNTVVTLVAKGANLIIGFMRGVLARVGGVVTFFVTLPGRIAGWLGDTVATLVAKGANLIIGLARGINDRMGGVVTTFTGLAGRIVGWVGNLGSALFSAGADIIRGLINGVQSKIGDLKSKLSEITSLIPKLKGPKATDRKLLTPAGQAIMESLIRGLDDRVPALRGFLGDVTTLLTGGLSPDPIVALAPGSVGSAAGFGPPVAVNITVNTLTGGPEVGRAVADALDSYFKTNGPRAWSRT